MILDLSALADMVADRVLERMRQQQAPTMFLTRRGVAARLGVSTSTVKRLQLDPAFPKPVRMMGGRPRWRASEIDAYASLSANSSAVGA